MNSLKNRVQLIGNVGSDAEVKTFDKSKMARFSLATNETFKNAAGEKVKETQWHQLVIWGKPAELAEKLLKKGVEVAIDGKLVTRSYTDKDNNKKYVTEVVVNEFVLLGSKN